MLGNNGVMLVISGCVAIEAGHEGVMVEQQPFFFGHGGVDPAPTKTGRVWVAPTTKVIEVDIRPLQYSEHFDIISAENAPVSFDALPDCQRRSKGGRLNSSDDMAPPGTRTM